MGEQLDLLTSSAAASPVRTSALLAAAKDWQAPAPGCGSKCSESCEKCGPFGSLLRTSLLCELEALTGCSGTWKRAVTPAGRSWWVLTTSDSRTEESGSGSSGEDWPTPTAASYGTSNNGSPGDGREVFATAGKASLETMAKEWPTPRASLSEQRQTKPTPSQLAGKHGRNLATEVNRENWPTPRAEDCEQIGAHRGKPDTLTSAMLVWSTPHGMGELKDPHGSELSQQVRVTEGLSDWERSALKVGLWPTATAGDAKASGSRTTTNSKAHPGISLTDAAVHGLSIDDEAKRRQWVSPTSRDWKDTAGQDLTDEKHGTNQLPRQVFAGLPDQDSSSTPGKPDAPSQILNANWVFQLMGYPEDWARLSTGPGLKPPEIP